MAGILSSSGVPGVGESEVVDPDFVFFSPDPGLRFVETCVTASRLAFSALSARVDSQSQSSGLMNEIVADTISPVMMAARFPARVG